MSVIFLERQKEKQFFKIKSILIHEYQHKSTRVNTNQHESDTTQHESLTRVNTNQHESKTSQQESDTSQHESTVVKDCPR